VETADTPVLLINCDPTPESAQRFTAMTERYGLDLLDAPVRRHGDTLDWLFSHAPDDALLLLDSDAELRSPALVGWMKARVQHPRTFGAGYLEGPFWMDEAWSAPARSMLYMERPWVPALLLQVAFVRRALSAGRHFGEMMVPNEVGFSKRASWLLASRFGPPYGPHSPTINRLPPWVRTWLANRRLDGLAWARHPYYGLRPKIACYDTAARIYEYLRFQEGLLFAGIDIGFGDDTVHHYGGISRNARYGPTPLDRSAAEIEDEVRQRLWDRYHFAWEAL
jgi:hypothetical protein